VLDKIVVGYTVVVGIIVPLVESVQSARHSLFSYTCTRICIVPHRTINIHIIILKCILVLEMDMNEYASLNYRFKKTYFSKTMSIFIFNRNNYKNTNIKKITSLYPRKKNTDKITKPELPKLTLVLA